MSLTGLLKVGRGPVWEWFVEHFSQTQRVSTHATESCGPEEQTRHVWSLRCPVRIVGLLSVLWVTA